MNTWCQDMPADLVRFDYIDSVRGVVRDVQPTDVQLSSAYGIGIYSFRKKIPT